MMHGDRRNRDTSFKDALAMVKERVTSKYMKALVVGLVYLTLKGPVV